jgi:hypothetical protein
MGFLEPIMELASDKVLKKIVDSEIGLVLSYMLDVLLNEFLDLSVGFFSNILIDLFVMDCPIHVHLKETKVSFLVNDALSGWEVLLSHDNLDVFWLLQIVLLEESLFGEKARMGLLEGLGFILSLEKLRLSVHLSFLEWLVDVVIQSTKSSLG